MPGFDSHLSWCLFLSSVVNSVFKTNQFYSFVQSKQFSGTNEPVLKRTKNIYFLAYSRAINGGEARNPPGLITHQSHDVHLHVVGNYDEKSPLFVPQRGKDCFITLIIHSTYMANK